MNPFDTLVLDEPPLSFGPDSLVAQGRKAVRRRRAMTVASGVGLAACGVAVAVPLVSPAERETTVRVGDPTPTPDPEDLNVYTHIPTLVRLFANDASVNGHRLISLAPRPLYPGSASEELKRQVTMDLLVDDSTTVVSWGLPAHGQTACDLYEGITLCKPDTLSDGATVFAASGEDRGSTRNHVVLFRADGTKIVLDSYDVAKRSDGDVPSPSGEPAYSLEQLRALAVEMDGIFNRE